MEKWTQSLRRRASGGARLISRDLLIHSCTCQRAQRSTNPPWSRSRRSVSEVLFIAQLIRNLATVRRCVGGTFGVRCRCATFSGSGARECVEALCGSLVDVTGLLLDVVLRGTPAFGGVRIPGSVAHIEIGLGGHMAQRREPDCSEVRRELETSRPSFLFKFFSFLKWHLCTLQLCV